MANLATPMPQIRAKFTNKLGIPLSGCKVYTYEPNSDIPKTTWIDTDKTVENTNPILLDAAGEADIFLDGLYRVVVKDRFGFVVYDVEKTGTHTEWDASFVVDGNENQHEINRTTVRSVNTIADLMSLQNPKNDQVVSVKGYYAPTNFALAQPYKGGGQRIYVESRKTENDGFLCINGWVLTGYGNELDTYQSGFADGDLTDHSDKFQAMLSSLPDGTHLKVYGEHRVSTAMLVSNKDNITIEFVDGAVLSAKELRDSFVFKGYDGSLNGSGARGILHFHQCNNPKVIKPTIRGCQKHNLNSPEPWEDGDSGVGFSMCTNPLVEHGDISHTTAWGIIAERSTNSIAQFNKVYDVLRQSGISLTINEGNGGSALFNTVWDVALYGIEWEVYTDSFKNKSFGNIVINCQKGEASVGNVCELMSSGNTYTNCYQGVNSENTNVANSRSIVYTNNRLLNCWRGSVCASAGQVNVHDNTMEMRSPPTYYITNAYDTVLEVTTDTSFVALGRSGIVNGSSIRINGVIYTVTAVATVTDTKYGSGTLKNITVNASLAGVRDMTQIYTLPSSNMNHSTFFAGVNASVDVYNNKIKGYAVGVKSDVANASASTVREKFRDNAFENVARYFDFQATGLSLRMYNNVGAVYDSLGNISAMAASIFPRLSKTQVYRSTSLKKSLRFYLQDRLTVCMVEVLFVNADGSCTGTTVVQLDGSQNIATISSANLNSTINRINTYTIISSGLHTLLLTDTVGDLSYTEVIVSLYSPV